MSSAPRVSAFAKRRRLNDGTAAPTSDPDIPSPKKPLLKLKSKKASSENVVQAPDISVPSGESEGSLGGDSLNHDSNRNNFEALVEAKIVKFSGRREIEQLDKRSVKVLLSQGQKCVISGVARLWVRHGSISVCGALLHESPKTFPLYALPSHGLPEIVAQSKLAEFQLESMLDMEALTSISPKILIKHSPETVGQDRTFSIVDYDDESILALMGAVVDVGMSQMGQQLVQSVWSRRSQLFVSHPRILLCGRRSQDTSRATVATINNLLTQRVEFTGSPQRIGVLMLDLDFTSPAFAAPGTMSLTLFREPVLGPAHLHPLTTGVDSTNQLVDSLFLGAAQTAKQVSPDPSLIRALLQNPRIQEGMPLIVRSGSWLTSLSGQELAYLHKIVMPTSVVSIDRTKSSQHFDAACALAKEASVPLDHFPLQVVSTLSSVVEHRALLRSHFALHSYCSNVPLWYTSISPDLMPRAGRWNFGSGAGDISFIAIKGGRLQQEDICEVLDEALVTVVGTTKRADATIATNSSTPIDGNTEPRVLPMGELSSLDISEVWHCLGPAYINSIDPDERIISMNTLVTQDVVQQVCSQNLMVGIVLEKPGVDGRYSRNLLFE